MEPEYARKVEAMVNEGATIVGNGIMGTPSLNNYIETDKEIHAISEHLFGTFNTKNTTEKRVLNVGKGKVYCGYTIQEALALENIAKDVTVLDDNKDITWIHRTDGNEHYYFIANKAATAKSCRVNFRIDGMQPEIWNPVTGQITDALVWKNSNGQTTVTLNMEGNGSCFVVFRTKSKNQANAIKSLTINEQPVNASTYLTPTNQLVLKVKGMYKVTLQNNKVITKQQDEAATNISLNNHWKVRFQEHRGAPFQANFDSLISWPLSTDTGIKYFSGTAYYTNSFLMDAKELKPNKRILIDLGKVKNVATITINQKEVGVIWKPPFLADITNYCKAGDNKIEVAVTNLWLNRIIGDKSQPDDCLFGPMRSYTYVPSSPKVGRNMLEIPDWVKNKTERPSNKKITFCTMDFFEKDTPLLPSGLIGPVQIEVEDVFNLNSFQ